MGRSTFLTYLEENTMPRQRRDYEKIYDEINNHCASKGWYDGDILEIRDLDTMAKIRYLVDKKLFNGLFFAVKKKSANRAMETLYDYVENNQKAGDDGDISREEIREEVENKLESEFYLKQLNFEEEISYEGTKPLKFMYREKFYKDFDSWTEMYVCMMKVLYEDFDNVIWDLDEEPIICGTDMDFASTEYMLHKPVPIRDDMWIETDLDEDDIVDRIKAFFRRCCISSEDLPIYYAPAEEDVCINNQYEEKTESVQEELFEDEQEDWEDDGYEEFFEEETSTDADFEETQKASEIDNEDLELVFSEYSMATEFKTLSRNDAAKAMSEWINSGYAIPDINSSMEEIRESIHKIYNDTVREMENDNLNFQRDKYEADIRMGMKIYEYFNHLPGFSMRYAANDDFWRYISIMVAPDIVAKRWGPDNEEHYWKKGVRIWFRSIWWFIHLSWQGDAETTMEMLHKGRFDTDTILNLEERTGREGTFVVVCRFIMNIYSELSIEDINRYSSERSGGLFRTVMKLHTAKMIVAEPALYEGGEYGYAKSLFEDVGVL